jgi:membrane protein YdbS with pleckstrin-like domain
LDRDGAVVFRVLREFLEELRNPDLIVASYLSSQEEVYYDDPPALQSFLFFNWWEIALVGVLLLADIGFLLSGHQTAFLLTFVAVDVLVIVLVVQRFQQLFTRYVVTSSRLMRISGVIKRQSQSIPWAKVTDLTFRQSLWMRYFGFADVRIESANEATSGLQNLNGLKNPLQFYRLVLEMVASKQGHVTPESGEVPLAKFEADSDIRKRAQRMSSQPRQPTEERPSRPRRSTRAGRPARRSNEAAVPAGWRPLGGTDAPPRAPRAERGGIATDDDGPDDDSVLYD